MFESIESTLYPIVCDINTYLSMPKKAISHIQKMAPGPPVRMAPEAPVLHQDPLRPDPLLQGGLEQRVRQPVAARQEA